MTFFMFCFLSSYRFISSNRTTIRKAEMRIKLWNYSTSILQLNFFKRQSHLNNPNIYKNKLSKHSDYVLVEVHRLRMNLECQINVFSLLISISKIMCSSTVAECAFIAERAIYNGGWKTLRGFNSIRKDFCDSMTTRLTFLNSSMVLRCCQYVNYFPFRDPLWLPPFVSPFY